MPQNTNERTAPAWDVTAQQALMDALLEGIVVIDANGIIERVNQATEDIFGYAQAEMIGKDLGVLMPSPDREHHKEYIQRYLRTGQARIIGIGREMQGQRKNGSYFPVHLAIAEVRWSGAVRFVGMMRDLTDYKLAEERKLRLQTNMLAASRLTTMGEMAAAIAHEINQPLAAIANFASASGRLLDRDSDHLDDVRAALRNIDEQAQRAGEIIRRLRGFVQPELVSRNATSLDTIIKELVPLAELDARAHNIALKIDIPRDLPAIDADSLQIQQVILNLLRNAIDAMSEARPEDRLLMVVGSRPSEEAVSVEIIDRGHGISEETGRNLFNPFYTTKSAGMGMGLSICQSIVNSHGGTLSFANNLDAGATFSVTLPVKTS